MALYNAVVLMVRVLAYTHSTVGALLIIFGVADGLTPISVDMYTTFSRQIIFVAWIGTLMCLSGDIGILRMSTPQKPQRFKSFTGAFMGFSITSTVFGGIIIMACSRTIDYASYIYSRNNYGNDYPRARRYSYAAKMGLAYVILILAIIEFVTGIWVSICLCLMKPCCTGSQQQRVAFPGSTPGNTVSQGVDGVPVAVPLQAFGVTVQTQPFYDYSQAEQTTIGGSVSFQAVGNEPHLVVDTLPNGGHLQDDAKKAQELEVMAVV